MNGTYAAPVRESESSAREDDQCKRGHDQAQPDHCYYVLDTTDSFPLRLDTAATDESHCSANGSGEAESDSEEDSPDRFRRVRSKPQSHVALGEHCESCENALDPKGNQPSLRSRYDQPCLGHPTSLWA
jgi:hypothetical protein